MIIIPAIDLKDKQVVRYTKGIKDKKIYSSDPVAVALDWQRLGARWLHIVDLDGAISGEQKNLSVIKKIIRSVRLKVEVGGGIRALPAIKGLIDSGASRIVLGTKAIEDPAFLEEAVKKFGKRIAVGLDTSGGKMGLYGWRKSCKIQLRPRLRFFEDIGLQTIISTDIKRDGTLKGVDLEAIERMLQATKIDLIVSGGVSSLDDIRKLTELPYRNLKGVIVGKALYENRFTLNEAIKIA